MTVHEILTRLESLGDNARRAHNTKAGAPDNQFGVKLGDIRAMAKKIKTDHELALTLWDTGNVEAQLLATLIIKPTSLSADTLDKLTRSTTCTQVADWLNAYVVAQHPEKEALREKWMKAKDRWAARAGWNFTASRVNKSADGLDLDSLLDRIEKEMPKAKPEVQWTMNNTLAAIGIHHPKHRKRARHWREDRTVPRLASVQGLHSPLCAGVGGRHGETAGLRGVFPVPVLSTNAGSRVR